MHKKSPISLLVVALIFVTILLPVIYYESAPPDSSTAACISRLCPFAGLVTMSDVEQWMAVAIGFVVKPFYMLLALGLSVFLWRYRASDLRSLAWGLFFFWFGENACAVNWFFHAGRSDLWEYLHNYGMAIGFSFMAFSLFEGLDSRVVHYSSAKDRCAFLGLCCGCIKYSDVKCALQQVFRLLIPAVIVMALVPLSAPLNSFSYDATILGKSVTYSIMYSSQLFEIRYCPIVALLLLFPAWAVLIFKREDPVTLAKILFAGALGPLAFSFMRLFLTGVFAENLFLFNTWEELTELIFVVAFARILWLFRKSLFGKGSAVTEASSTSG